MEDNWIYVVQVFTCFVIHTRGDTDMGEIGPTPVDPIKEMLKRFDASPWTMFFIETTTSKIEREMREYMELHKNMEDIEKEMRIHGIIPDFLQDAPKNTLEMRFRHPDTNLTRHIHLGEIYPPSLCLNKPLLKFKTTENTSYVKMFVDPDHICSRYEPEIDSSYEDMIPTTVDDGIPKTFVHYLRVNIPHDNFTDGGEDIVEYLPPHPPNGTGLHRYMYLVYEQPHQYINFTEKRIESTTAYERDWFQMSEFEKKYNLPRPVAGTFFYARFDEAVPYIYAGLHDVLI